MINIIKEKLLVNNTVNVVIENSNWKLHSLEGYTENELNICSDFAKADGFDAIREKSIKYYLDNEAHFYTLFTEKIKRMLEFEDFYGDYDFEPAFDAYEIELPETVSNEWIKENIKLIQINIREEKEGMCFLEFDFAVSWDEEHGLVALTLKDKFVGFAEGGYCWYLD